MHHTFCFLQIETKKNMSLKLDNQATKMQSATVICAAA